MLRIEFFFLVLNILNQIPFSVEAVQPYPAYAAQ